ncbi:MAG: glycosyltransferase family 9 protein [Maricaulaceae bacterium]
MKTDAVILVFGPAEHVVDTLGAVARVRALHKGGRIIGFTHPSFRALLSMSPAFERVEIAEPSTLQSHWALAQRIRSLQADVVYDFDATPSGRLLVRCLSPFGPRCVAPESSSAPWVDRVAAVLGSALDPASLVTDLRFLARRADTQPRLQPAFFSIKAPYVLLAPGRAATLPQAAGWTIPGLARAVETVRDAGYQIVIVGGAEAREAAKALAAAAPGSINLSGRADWIQIGGLALKAAAVVGFGDAWHKIAVAAGAPSVLFCADLEDGRQRAPAAGACVRLCPGPTGFTPKAVSDGLRMIARTPLPT